MEMIILVRRSVEVCYAMLCETMQTEPSLYVDMTCIDLYVTCNYYVVYVTSLSKEYKRRETYAYQ
jgi:hypothetical protein